MSRRHHNRPLCAGIVLPGPNGELPSKEDMRKLGFVISAALEPSKEALPKCAEEVAAYGLPAKRRR